MYKKPGKRESRHKSSAEKEGKNKWFVSDMLRKANLTMWKTKLQINWPLNLFPFPFPFLPSSVRSAARRKADCVYAIQCQTIHWELFIVFFDFRYASAVVRRWLASLCTHGWGSSHKDHMHMHWPMCRCVCESVRWCVGALVRWCASFHRAMPFHASPEYFFAYL